MLSREWMYEQSRRSVSFGMSDVSENTRLACVVVQLWWIIPSEALSHGSLKGRTYISNVTVVLA